MIFQPLKTLAGGESAVIASCACGAAIQEMHARSQLSWIAAPKPARNDGEAWDRGGLGQQRLF